MDRRMFRRIALCSPIVLSDCVDSPAPCLLMASCHSSSTCSRSAALPISKPSELLLGASPILSSCNYNEYCAIFSFYIRPWCCVEMHDMQSHLCQKLWYGRGIFTCHHLRPDVRFNCVRWKVKSDGLIPFYREYRFQRIFTSSPPISPFLCQNNFAKTSGAGHASWWCSSRCRTTETTSCSDGRAMLVSKSPTCESRPTTWDSQPRIGPCG